ncbi:MAG: ABC transporter ATP-binding protein [Thermoplasmata archaeon]|nr:ABC transporter ATP-binding protein [Thermoplasmata archaeon]
MLEVRELFVKYGNFTAVKGISFDVEEGEIFGLLGPNGAGKSSTLKSIMGLVNFEGEIKLLGEKIGVEERNLIGYVPEEFMLIDVLTPLEFFEFVASLRKINSQERLFRLIYAFELEKYVNKPIASLSMGTKQKVAIIAALMHDPKLLILDEPLNGLDAKSSRILKEMMKRHVEKGGAVLFSTHIMEIAEKLCDRIAVINKGEIVAMGTIEELRKKAEVEGNLEDIFLKLTGEDEYIRGVVDALSR